jgi:hypothetical protein
MGTLGFPGLFAFVPIALLWLRYYAVIFFCIWKFWQMLSKINDNIAGIRPSLVRNGERQPNPPV